jgi:hypothetical protein
MVNPRREDLMKQRRMKNVFVYILGMLTLAVGWFIVSTFIIVERPTMDGVIEEWEQICFWPDEGGVKASVSPRGCFSTSCTYPKLQTGTAIVDRQAKKIQLETSFVLVKTSRFPFPCTENCAGGGSVQFDLGELIPNIYEVWFRDEWVGDLNIYSGLPTPNQCFENVDEEPIKEVKSLLESTTWIAAENESAASRSESIRHQVGKGDSWYWVTMEDPHYGIRFAVPCFWQVDMPEENYRGLTYIIRNYSYEYSVRFPRNDKDFWDSGGIKIDMAFPRKMHGDMSMADYVSNLQGEADDFKLVSTEEIIVNGQRSILVTTESVFGIGQFYLFDLNEEVFLLVSLSPKAIHNTDVQGVLHSLAIDPDTSVEVPDYPPGYPLDEVITDCKGANELKVLMSSQKTLAWGSGEAVKLHFALINLTTDQLYVLDWFTPFEGMAGDIFRIIYDGRPVKYQGNLAERGNPTPESYLLIEPVGAAIIEVNLSKVYDFSRPGRYTIAYKSPRLSDIAWSAEGFATTLDELGPVYISSNEIAVEILVED